MTRKSLLLLASAILVVSCSSSNKSESFSSRSATSTREAQQGTGSVLRLDPALDHLVPKDVAIEKLAGGFQFTEGPLWRPQLQVLWFSDVVGNVVRQWSPNGEVKVLIQKASGDPGNLPQGGFVGPNGEIADKDGNVLICQHTARSIVRVGQDLRLTPLVERYEGKRFNSPNDLVYRSDATLYFTDPPYGLAKQDEDPTKEIPFNGVYRLKNGKVDVIVKDLSRPNGIAFSPDQKVLYVANSDEKRKVWMRYDVAEDGTVSNGRVFFDVTAEKEDGLPDGMKVDSQGNIYATGPGGVWVFSPDGKHLGTIKPRETPANCNWGDDGKSLYITARTGLYRIKLAVAGERALYQ
jgi:gluconolactonase